MKPSLKLLDYSILQQCMHCGMCLPACPTYVATNKERHSPRGRISLMRAVADGELKLSPAFADEMSYCLGCLACQTACPAGVDYSNLLVGTFGHMGDGNLHPTFLTDERNTEEMARVHEALEDIVTKTLALGGTITGEHGVGLAKKAWLRRQVGENSHDLMREIKRAWDPQNLLNPGKIFD